jgi:hypothetical protein
VEKLKTTLSESAAPPSAIDLFCFRFSCWCDNSTHDTEVTAMKISGKMFGLLLVFALLASSALGQATPPPPEKKDAPTGSASNVHTPDDPEILRETQLGMNFNGQTGLVWWVPFEFWVNSAVKNGTSPERARKELGALQQYTIVGVLLGKVSALGSIDYVAPADLQKKTVIRDSDGQDYPAVVELTGDAKSLADIMKPILANAMGRAGENFAMIFYPAKGKSGKSIADATSKGHFSVVLREIAGEPETVFFWRTPLTSLSAPRYCPVGKERVHADWDYCPWHGVKLEDKQ